jgi:putative inorganic carbon (HCO3(-)) transporter
VYGLTLVWLITIISAVGAVVRPRIGLYAYVFLATLRPHFLFGWAGNLANVSEIVGTAMIVGWVLNGFGAGRMGRATPITLVLVLFTGWVWLSATQAIYPSASYLWGIEMLKILAPFVVGVTMLSRPEEWRTLIWIIVGTTGYLSLEMNLSYLRGYNQVWYGYGGMDNNSFGIALVTTLGPAFGLALTEKKKWVRGAAVLCMAFILHTILLTYSRGAFVGLLVLGVTTFVLMPKRPKYVLAVLVIGLVTLRFVGPQLAERWESTFASAEERDGSAESRIDLWRDCLAIASDHPVFGIGPRNFPLIAHEYGWTNGKEAHSVWMQMLAETGFPGVGLLALFFVSAMIWLWPLARPRAIRVNSLEGGVALGVILGITGFMVAGQFVSLAGLETPYYVVLTGLVLMKDVRSRVVVPATVAVESPPLARQPMGPRAPRLAARGPLPVSRTNRLA